MGAQKRVLAEEGCSLQRVSCTVEAAITVTTTSVAAELATVAIVAAAIAIVAAITAVAIAVPAELVGLCRHLLVARLRRNCQFGLGLVELCRRGEGKGDSRDEQAEELGAEHGCGCVCVKEKECVTG
tara:strand:+ start:136 stop:516 length:381 start_codon:yes stop_codon:yes gene_type:complete